ncbi:hypothetical protein OIU74_018059 [Salix koriyanagi]|uniref:Uncharacterized protein n=1 Tax=Salix koriyanagi TaxID=2511006 RepID=A0A9Q0WRB7_9ROSI|nr:hypothetical protein OIU74_018059 [Salix koriyanagi]
MVICLSSIIKFNYLTNEEMLYHQTDAATLDKTAFVVLDMESLAQPSDRSSGSPKMTRALSRKWSYRAERWTGNEEEGIDETAKKPLIKGSSQLDPLKQQLVTSKAPGPSPTTSSGPNLPDQVDGWGKRFNRLMAINPRKILFIFATMSSMGTLMLIYFTLAISRST